MVPVGSRVLVGYSGGADSTCLLHILRVMGFELVAGHLHHGMRPEADDEQLLCREFAESIGCEFASGKADVPKMAKALKMGIEEAGRKARYAFFDQVALQTGCELIATAHTLDDHAETIVFNLIRGSGLSGLGGIQARRDNIVRPLLPFRRSETRAYCAERGFWFHDDPANDDDRFSRVRIRKRILPEFEAINSDVLSALDRMSTIVAAEDAFLDGIAASALDQCEIPLNGDLRFLTQNSEFAVAVSKLLSMPAVVVKRALRLGTSALGGSLDSRLTEALLTLLTQSEKGSITTELETVRIEWKDGLLHLTAVETPKSFRYSLATNGSTDSAEFGWTLDAAHVNEATGQPKRDALAIEMDMAQIKLPLSFRSHEPGDRIEPLGFEGTRKIADLMSESKLTLMARARMPIICDMAGPIWVPGICLSNRVKCTGNTTKVLQLRFGPAAP